MDSCFSIRLYKKMKRTLYEERVPHDHMDPYGASEALVGGREPPSKKEKQQSCNNSPLRSSSLNSLLQYDRYVLQKIFSYCHPKFMYETLMIICPRWYFNYFQKKCFVMFLKEWLLDRWNFLIQDLDSHKLGDAKKNVIIPKILQQLNAEMSEADSEQILKYGLRLLKLFMSEHPFDRRKKQNMNDDDDDNDDFDENEEDDEQEDDLEEDDSEAENEDHEDESYQGSSKEDEEVKNQNIHSEWFAINLPKYSRCYSLEIIFTTDDQTLYKLNWTKGLSIFDNTGGNIINFLCDRKLIFANFYGGYYYPDYEQCPYRKTDFWVKISNHEGILADQLKHILDQWSIEDNYENALNLLKTIGMENPKSIISKANYEAYPWDEGEARGIIHQWPWMFNEFVKQQVFETYLINDNIDISTIVDDRCFSDFSYFETLARNYGDCLTDLLAKAPLSFRKEKRLIPLINNNTHAFKFLHESLRHDKNMLLQMLEVNGNILKYLKKEEYQNIIPVDRNLVMFCLEHGCHPEYIPSCIPFDKELALCAVSGGCAINDLPKEFRNNLEVVLSAVKRNPFISLQFAKTLINDTDAALQLAKYSPYAFRWISDTVKKNHKEVVVAAIETFYDALRYVFEKEEFMELARQSLKQLLEKDKKICVKFTATYKIILDIKERHHQVVFMKERMEYVGGPSFQKVFGPCIEELGYDAVLTFELSKHEIENKTEEELIQTYVYPFLDSESNTNWDYLIETSALRSDSKVRELVESYRKK